MHKFIVYGSLCSSTKWQLETSSSSALAFSDHYQFKSSITTHHSPAGELLVEGKSAIIKKHSYSFVRVLNTHSQSVPQPN